MFIFQLFSMNAFFATQPTYNALLLRVASGAAMLPFGIMKIQTYDQTISFMTGAGIPWIIAILVIIAETLGALALILGLCTRFCAGSLAVIMVGAIFATYSMGYMSGFVIPLLFLIMFLSLTISGGGAWSADESICKKLSK